MAALIIGCVKMDEIKIKQVAMHKDFFDRCQAAIDNNFYLEALFLEYAAIEGRLEVILGVLGAPCNNKLPDDLRVRINVSHRIQCLKKVRKSSRVFENTKLEKNFFDKKHNLMNWINKRNRFIHGLYKNVAYYSRRLAEARELALLGLNICRALYNEVARIRRLKKNKPEFFKTILICNELCIQN